MNTTAEHPVLTVIVPLYNEAAHLPALHTRLSAVLHTLDLVYEIIFVDDGSRDASFETLRRFNAADAHVRIIRFARNFGKEAAMAAGLKAARGDAVVIIDGDLQHPPELIPEMLARWRDGAQMVTATRRTRDHDPLLRRLLTRLFYRLFRSVAEIALTEGGGDFRLFDRVVVDAILQMPERTRFMKGIASWVGFRQERVVFDPAERATGRSHWSMLRLLSYAIDGLSAFSTLPLRVWSGIGFVLALVSIVYGSWLVLRTWIYGIDVPGYASLMVATLFLSGIQLISLGVIGEYLGRVFTEVKQRPLYLISDRIGFDANNTHD